MLFIRLPLISIISTCSIIYWNSQSSLSFLSHVHHLPEACTCLVINIVSNPNKKDYHKIAADQFKAPGWMGSQWAMGSCRSSGASCSPRGSPGRPSYTWAACVWFHNKFSTLTSELWNLCTFSSGMIQPVNNGSNSHGIRVLPLVPRQRGNVLRKKSSCKDFQIF